MRDDSIPVPNRPRRSRLALPALALSALAALASCAAGGLDLDPSSHRGVPKAPTALTNPPTELKDGTAQ